MENKLASVSGWKLDKTHSEIIFRIRHMMISWISGSFIGFGGAVSFDEKGELMADLCILVDSISTGNSDRDQHLKSIDFFDAGLYPEIHFKSDRVISTSEGKKKLMGMLSIHGHTKPIELDVEISGPGIDP